MKLFPTLKKTARRCIKSLYSARYELATGLGLMLAVCGIGYNALHKEQPIDKLPLAQWEIDRMLRQSQQQSEEQKNLLGFCQDTHTYLYRDKEEFYTFVRQELLHRLKQIVRESSLITKELCKIKQCGVYDLQQSEAMLQDFLEQHRSDLLENLQRQPYLGYWLPVTRIILKNLMPHTLTDMPLDAYKNGFFLVIADDFATIFGWQHDVQPRLFTYDEVVNMNQPTSSFEERKRGIGNFYLKIRRLNVVESANNMDVNHMEDIETFFSDAFIPITNCGIAIISDVMR